MKNISAKNYLLFILCSLIFIVSFIGCGKDDGIDLSGTASSELERLGWQAFQNNNFSNAEMYFNELTKRDEHYYLVGHGGLGWTFLKTHQYSNSRNEFRKFFDLDTLNIYVPADSLTRDVRAGQTIVHSATLDHNRVLEFSNGFIANNNTNNNWRFRYDRTITVADVRLMRAVSQIALANFADAYAMVRLIDPTFETDINTVEGRIVLVRKIEEMILDRVGYILY